MSEYGIQIQKLEIIKKILDQRISEIKMNDWTATSKEEILFWEMVDKMFQLYLYNKEHFGYQFDEKIDQESKIKSSINMRFSGFFKKLWSKNEKIDEIIKQTILNTTLSFNKIKDIPTEKFIFPLDEFLIIDTDTKEIIYGATLWKYIEFNPEHITFFLDKINLINIGESIQAGWQAWYAPDIAVKIWKNKLLLINNTSYSINQLSEYWNWQGIKKDLEDQIKQIISIINE